MRRTYRYFGIVWHRKAARQWLFLFYSPLFSLEVKRKYYRYSVSAERWSVTSYETGTRLRLLMAAGMNAQHELSYRLGFDWMHEEEGMNAAVQREDTKQPVDRT